jgi:hypothetical protein
VRSVSSCSGTIKSTIKRARTEPRDLLSRCVCRLSGGLTHVGSLTQPCNAVITFVQMDYKDPNIHHEKLYDGPNKVGTFRPGGSVFFFTGWLTQLPTTPPCNDGCGAILHFLNLRCDLVC